MAILLWQENHFVRKAHFKLTIKGMVLRCIIEEMHGNYFLTKSIGAMKLYVETYL